MENSDFNSLSDKLQLSEEMIGAFLENNLSASEMAEMDSILAINPDYIDFMESMADIDATIADDSSDFSFAMPEDYLSQIDDMQLPDFDDPNLTMPELDDADDLFPDELNLGSHSDDSHSEFDSHFGSDDFDAVQSTDTDASTTTVGDSDISFF